MAMSKGRGLRTGYIRARLRGRSQARVEAWSELRGVAWVGLARSWSQGRRAGPLSPVQAGAGRGGPGPPPARLRSSGLERLGPPGLRRTRVAGSARTRIRAPRAGAGAAGRTSGGSGSPGGQRAAAVASRHGKAAGDGRRGRSGGPGSRRSLHWVLGDSGSPSPKGSGEESQGVPRGAGICDRSPGTEPTRHLRFSLPASGAPRFCSAAELGFPRAGGPPRTPPPGSPPGDTPAAPPSPPPPRFPLAAESRDGASWAAWASWGW